MYATFGFFKDYDKINGIPQKVLEINRDKVRVIVSTTGQEKDLPISMLVGLSGAFAFHDDDTVSMVAFQADDTVGLR